MKLEHRSNTEQARKLAARKPCIIQCHNGGHMARVMHSVRGVCEGSLASNDGLVAWDSQHHQILLWFEDEKYETYFTLKGSI